MWSCLRRDSGSFRKHCKKETVNRRQLRSHWKTHLRRQIANFIHAATKDQTLLEFITLQAWLSPPSEETRVRAFFNSGGKRLFHTLKCMCASHHSSAASNNCTLQGCTVEVEHPRLQKFWKRQTVEKSIRTCSPSFGITYHGTISLRLVIDAWNTKSKRTKDDA